MRLRFQPLADLTAAVCFTLAGVWLLAPSWLLGLWGVEATSSVDVVVHRAAALFVAIGIMFVQARRSAPCAARSALVLGFGSGCVLLALLGLHALLTGRAGVGIVPAIAVEIAFVMVFALLDRQESRKA
jgi:hypothetical protein